MPNYFKFYKKGDETKTPVKFGDIDEEVAKLFDPPIPVDPEKYVYGWYDTFGQAAAMGMFEPEKLPRFDEIVEKVGRPQDKVIYAYLKATYDVEAWYQPG